MTGPASAMETRLTVDRWINTFVVARGQNSGQSFRHAEIDDLQRRIDRCVAEDLALSCDRWLSQRLDQSSTAVWRIRELDLSFIVDLSSPAAGNVAQAWSEQMAACVSETIERGDRDGAMHFANRAAYLAQFVLDAAGGRARGKWYYDEFSSLSVLSTGKAICETLTGEPEQGRETILHLAQSGRLDEVLLVITEADAQAIYEQCFACPEVSPSAEDLSRWAGVLLELCNEEPTRPAGNAQKSFLDAIRWLSRAALRSPGAERNPAAHAAVNALLALQSVLTAIRSPIAADRLVRDLVLKKVTIAEAIARAEREGAASPDEGIRFLAQIANGDCDWAEQAAAVLLRDRRPLTYAASTGESMITPFGGIFLLGPALVDLNLKEIAETAAGEGDRREEIAGFLRHTVIAKCLGNSRAAEAMVDPAVRLLSGCDRPLLHEGSQLFDRLDLARAQAVFARNLALLTGCEGLCLLAEVIPLPSQELALLLLRDVAHDVWIYAAPYTTADREEVVVKGVDFVREITGNVPVVLLRGPLAELTGSQALHRQVGGLHTLNGEEAGVELAEVLCSTLSISITREKFSRLLASSAAEFSYLSYAAFWPEPDFSLDIFGALLARAVLKRFARRLMGFQSSSPEHLYRNFLEGISTVRQLAERVEIELPRSPLLLVLQLSGLAEQTHAIPWLEGREICLLPPRG